MMNTKYCIPIGDSIIEPSRATSSQVQYNLKEVLNKTQTVRLYKIHKIPRWETRDDSWVANT